MSFPTEYPIYQFFYWLVNTVGLGGIFVTIAAGGMLMAYGRILRWIGSGAKTGEKENYSYPSEAIHRNSSK